MPQPTAPLDVQAGALRHRSLTRPHKYGAKATWYAGQRYDSQIEARYAAHLDLLLAAGEIVQWTRPKPVELVARRGLRLTYRPDFWVEPKDGSPYYLDVKGVIPQSFAIRWKLWAMLRDELLRVVDGDGQEIQPKWRRQQQKGADH